jgi:hypothetical protein
VTLIDAHDWYRRARTPIPSTSGIAATRASGCGAVGRKILPTTTTSAAYRRFGREGRCLLQRSTSLSRKGSSPSRLISELCVRVQFASSLAHPHEQAVSAKPPAALDESPLVYCSPMAREAPRDLVAIATHVLDLRSEFEAQLRAVARLEAQLTKSSGRRDAASQELADVLLRELREMLKNNQNIRDVLWDLATVAGAAPA